MFYLIFGNINLRNIIFIILHGIPYCHGSWQSHCTGEQSCNCDLLSCLHYERTIVIVFIQKKRMIQT